MATFRLFVYGTLKRGGSRSHVLAGQRFLGPVQTQALYAIMDLGPYPGLVHESASKGQVVHGELYEVAESLRATLDRVEGAPALFRLEEVQLEGIPGPVLAYVYQRSVKGRPRCDEGTWQNVIGRDEEE